MLSYLLSFYVDISNAQNTKFALRNQVALCELQPKRGSCRMAITRYYYNINERVCEPFTYGGCSGNKNNFLSSEDCTEYCKGYHLLSLVKSSRPALCFQPFKTGYCPSHMLYFYFDAQTETCKSFLYTGCSGNENRFDTLEECEETCKVSNKDEPLKLNKEYLPLKFIAHT
ncbi:unnamed protein product, partial [Brenthis ino]